MKKVLALLMVLTLALSALAGCGEQTSEAVSSAPVEESAAVEAPEASAAEDPAPAEPEPEASLVEEAVTEEPTDDGKSGLIPEVDVVGEPGSISYPMADGSTVITLWNTMPDGPTARLFTSRNEQYCLSYAREATGIDLQYIEAAGSDVVEQFNLMVAAGDYADLIPAASYYTGGLTKAYSDEVIIDMTDIVAEYAPDMWDVYCGTDDNTWAFMLEDGMLLSFYNIYDEIYTEAGMLTRADWLEEQGISLEADLTLDEFTDYLYTMSSAYEADYALVPSSTGSFTNMYCFDLVTIPDVSGDTTDMFMYVENGTVKSAWGADGYRSYIEWFAKLYADGLFPTDFYTDSINQMVKDELTLAGDVVVWNSNADNCTELEARAEEGSAFKIVAIPNVVEETEDTCTWLEGVSRATSTNGLSITVDCKDPALVAQYMNYWYTPEGAEMFCCGPEGLTYEKDADGNRVWTETVTNNPDGFNVGQAGKLYSMVEIVSGLYDADRLFNVYAEAGREAIDIWTMPNATSEHYFPDAASLTTEENDQISTMVADLCTFTCTHIMNWLVGTEVLDDASWEAYLDELESFGIDEITAVYQNAYDEYLAGER